MPTFQYTTPDPENISAEFRRQARKATVEHTRELITLLKDEFDVVAGAECISKFAADVYRSIIDKLPI